MDSLSALENFIKKCKFDGSVLNKFILVPKVKLFVIGSLWNLALGEPLANPNPCRFSSDLFSDGYIFGV